MIKEKNDNITIIDNDDYSKPHFDIAQKSSIVWKDEVDLESRLYKRIEATVGLNARRWTCS